MRVHVVYFKIGNTHSFKSSIRVETRRISLDPSGTSECVRFLSSGRLRRLRLSRCQLKERSNYSNFIWNCSLFKI